MIRFALALLFAHEAPADRLPQLIEQAHAHAESSVESAEALFTLAEMHWRSGQIDAAHAVLKGLANQSPDGWHWLQGVLAETSGDLRSAETAFRRELKSQNPRSDAYPGLARVLEAQGRLSESSAAYFQAACTNPNPEDYLKAARLARRTGNPALAVDQLEQGLKLLGPAVALRFERAQALAEMGDKASALHELEALLKLAPRHSKWRQARAQIQETVP
jgi:tetratricopeptide (TPR) repeat protein